MTAMKPGDASRLWTVIGVLEALVSASMPIPRALAHLSVESRLRLHGLHVAIAQPGALAALVTAVVSAITLNFFPTEPYLSLQINKADDVVAFGALPVPSPIAAAFGRRREQMSELAERAFMSWRSWTSSWPDSGPERP